MHKAVLTCLSRANSTNHLF